MPETELSSGCSGEEKEKMRMLLLCQRDAVQSKRAASPFYLYSIHLLLHLGMFLPSTPNLFLRGALTPSSASPCSMFKGLNLISLTMLMVCRSRYASGRKAERGLRLSAPSRLRSYMLDPFCPGTRGALSAIRAGVGRPDVTIQFGRLTLDEKTVSLSVLGVLER